MVKHYWEFFLIDDPAAPGIMHYGTFFLKECKTCKLIAPTIIKDEDLPTCDEHIMDRALK